MSTRYRVTVEQIEDVDGAQYETRETVLFEATSPSMERLAAFAPVEVLAALGGAAGSLRMDGHVEADGNVVTYPMAPSPAEANREAMLRDEAAEAGAGRPTRRKRRSKEQIAADEAAALQVAEVDLGEPDVPIDEPTLAAVELADAETGNPSEPAVPAAPFNPFLR